MEKVFYISNISFIIQYVSLTYNNNNNNNKHTYIHTYTIMRKRIYVMYEIIIVIH